MTTPGSGEFTLGPSSDEPDDEPSLDERLRVLSNRRRRRLLQHLLGTDAVDVTEVPSVVTGDGDDIEKVVVQMYHLHLPMLGGKGIVVWDRDEGVVYRGPDFDAIRPLVELLADHREELQDEQFDLSPSL